MFVGASNSQWVGGYRGYRELVWAPKGHYLIVHYEPVNMSLRRHLRGIFAASSGAACALSGESHFLPGPLLWSLPGKYCLLTDDTGCVYSYDPSVSGKLASALQTLGRYPGHLRQTCAHSALDKYIFVPGARDVVQVDTKDFMHSRISHWVYNAETGSSTQHGVSGFDSDLAGELSADSIAWHPTLKAAKIYALVENGPAAAVHLIDMRRHCRLVTWTSEDLASILPKGSGRPSIGWSMDGKQLAVVNSYGVIILDFATDKAS